MLANAALSSSAFIISSLEAVAINAALISSVFRDTASAAPEAAAEASSVISLSVYRASPRSSKKSLAASNFS
ncbi:MAG: hypothetical protein II104_00370 [Oscillospiraceae bacterium]|nr:hypothetical protein [Oscillospiraceae bacterium]